MNTTTLYEKFYYSQPAFVDGTSQFHKIMGDAIPAGSRILEIGAGPSNRTSQLLAGIGHVVGVDISGEITQNIYLNEAHVCRDAVLPFSSESFDACVSDYVLEHIEDPSSHFREVARVLKNGGVYYFRTPNLFHYSMLASKLLPHRIHKLLANRLRSLDEEAHEPYPTCYKANTFSRLAATCTQAGLDVQALTHIEKEPAYGRIHPLIFVPMMCYERVVNSADIFSRLRVNILGIAVKP